jgi:ABC-type antimicrobial peptide transport system permease subunit
MEVVAAEATARPRFRAQLVTALAATATILAAVGIFSLLSFMVQQRAREFSVRLAIGAGRLDLIELVLSDGLRLVAVGVLIGIVASALLARSLESLLFGVAPVDPVTFLTAPAVLTLVAVLACLTPAISALRSDPVAALRSE